ncbi:hypothetical protein SNEBB_008333 [Seison nebaliae]|nr:hypothetical protein SNEBB_008333 [Seison nebaliae]
MKFIILFLQISVLISIADCFANDFRNQIKDRVESSKIMAIGGKTKTEIDKRLKVIKQSKGVQRARDAYQETKVKIEEFRKGTLYLRVEDRYESDIDLIVYEMMERNNMHAQFINNQITSINLF